MLLDPFAMHKLFFFRKRKLTENELEWDGDIEINDKICEVDETNINPILTITNLIPVFKLTLQKSTQSNIAKRIEFISKLK